MCVNEPAYIEQYWSCACLSTAQEDLHFSMSEWGVFWGDHLRPFENTSPTFWLGEGIQLHSERVRKSGTGLGFYIDFQISLLFQTSILQLVRPSFDISKFGTFLRLYREDKIRLSQLSWWRVPEGVGFSGRISTMLLGCHLVGGFCFCWFVC